MLPKKKSMIIPIIYGVFLVLIILLALHCAVVCEDVSQMIESGEIVREQLLLAFFELFFYRMENSLFSISFNRYTRYCLLYGAIAWIIMIIAIESNRKNYIHGKEFGTSKWGTLNTIKDLFASSIEAEEIKRAKRMRIPFGRWLVKSKLFKQCEKSGEIILKVKLEELKVQEKIQKKNGTADKKLYKEKQEEIKREVEETVALAKRQAWKPAQLEADCKSYLQEIEASSVITDAEKEHRKDLVKQEYNNKLKTFYNYSERIAEIKAKYKDADMLFTKTERISFYNWVLNQNTLIMGGSGSGKTRGFVLPNILQAHSSYIVTDPKGEILEKSGYFLSQIKGYKIRCLNIDDMAQSDGYNPFVYIHPERDEYEKRVYSLIETLIVNTKADEKQHGNDPFWEQAERLFLQAIFFFTVDGFVPEERNMNTVLDLIAMLKVEEDGDKMDSDLDIYVRVFAERFGKNHIGVQQYNEFRTKASGKTAKSVIITSVARLAPFRIPAIQRIFSYDSMHLELVGEEKTAIFISVPPTETAYNFIPGMLFTQLFQELQYCATQKHKREGQRLPVPCRFILDEFATTCKIPNFVRILAYARSLGIGIAPIIQSLEQIKNMYEKEWGVIIDNCNTLLYLGSINHMDTLEYMSKLLGKATFDKQTTGRTRGHSGSSSKNEDVVGRELQDASDVRKLKKQNCYLIVGGRDPFYSEKYDYTSHPNYIFTSDANKAYSFHYKPESAPEKGKKEVEEPAHREDEQVDTPMLSENAFVEIKPIIVDESTTNQLGRLTKTAATLVPIPDELMTVNDGENTAEEVNQKTLEELIGEEEAERKKAKLTVSDETQAYLDNLRNERIRIEENLLQTVNRLGRTYRNLVPIPDELLKVEDGEDASEIDEKALGFIMDDEEQTSAEELEDVLADAGAILSDFDDLSELDA